MREIEVKMRVTDMKALETSVSARGCKLSDQIYQHDICYSLPEDAEQYDSPGQALGIRIRREGNKASFTVKKSLTNESDSLEAETTIKDADQMNDALLMMGYLKLLEVKKMRRKGKLGEYEICLDEVEGLGSFAELEKLTDDNADPVSVQNELLNIFESLGIPRTAQEHRGYDTQVYALKNK